MSLIGALDQGTTSTRFLVYNNKLEVEAEHQIEHRQISTQAGWLEHDPLELLEKCRTCMAKAVAALGPRSSELVAVGITNQRQTTVVWDKTTGAPLYNAIVWSDTRTVGLVEELTKAWGGKDALRPLCGLPLSTFFTALKLRWLLDHCPAVKTAVDEGRCMAGTVDSWLMYNFSGGRVHLTDVTNASCTMLMNIATGQWDPGLCAHFGVPVDVLPTIRSNTAHFCVIAEGCLKGVPIVCSIGDQQAATVGQACFNVGQAKCTYGTGAFVLANTGPSLVQSRHGLLTTVCYQLEGQERIYALEGAVANAGAVIGWLRHNLGILGSAAESEALAAQVDDCGGVVFVPAFSGLFAPHWRSDARAAILGLSQFSTRAHICRAGLEGICCQIQEVLGAMEQDSGQGLSVLAVDGGMTQNALLMQLQADISGLPVVRAGNTESTSLGCAMLTGLAVGLFRDTAELARLVGSGGPRAAWQPRWDDARRAEHAERWQRAVAKSLSDARPIGSSPLSRL